MANPSQVTACVVVALAVAGCGGAQSKGGARAGEARQCQPPEETSRLMVVDWDPASRAALETGVVSGVAVVRYDGCALELLDDCRLPGEYASEEAPRSRSGAGLRGDEEVVGRLPLGGAQLAEEVGGAEIALDYVTASTERARLDGKSRGMLTGRCDRATHFVRSMVRGAYEISSRGRDATATRVLRSGGDIGRCEDAATSQADPACRAVVQVALTPIAELTSDRDDLFVDLDDEVAAISDVEEALRALQALGGLVGQGEVPPPPPSADDPTGVSQSILALPDGGSDAWDAQVLPLLVGAFDKNSSRNIDTMDEIAAIPCGVLSALDIAVKRGRGPMTALRTTYGFAADFLWVGGALGFDEKVRADADARLANCGL